VSDYLIGLRYNMYWSFDFYLIVLIGILYPVLPAIAEFWKKPRQWIHYLFISTGVYTSLTVSSTLSILSNLVTGITFFPTTGDMEENQVVDQNTHWFDFRSNTVKVIFFEILSGLALLWVSVKSHNLWFLPLAAACLLTPALIHKKYTRSLRIFLYLPFLIQLVLIVLIGKNLLS